MEQSLNKLTYRYNEKANQLIEIKPNPSLMNQDGLGIANEDGIANKDVMLIPNADIKVKETRPSLSSVDQSQSNWPDLEQLEALIRQEELPVKHTTEEDVLQEMPINEYINPAPKDLPDTRIEKAAESNAFNWYEKYENIGQLNDNIDIKTPLRSSSKSSSVAWGKFMLSVFSSVITGVLIGYVLLLAVYGSQVWPISSITNANPSNHANAVVKTDDVSVPTHNPLAEGKDVISSDEIIEPSVVPINDIANTDESNNAQKVMQRFQYVVLQAGIFSKIDSRDALLQSLQKKSYPNSVLQNEKGQYIVLSGLAVSSEDAKLIAQTQSDVELYRKTIDIDVPVLAEQEELDGLLQQWVYDTNILMQSYMQLIAAQYEQGSFSEIHKDSENVIADAFNKWVKETDELKDVSGLASEALDNINVHKNEFTELHNNLLQYQKQPQAQPLKNMTQHLLTMLSHQYAWYQSRM